MGLAALLAALGCQALERRGWLKACRRGDGLRRVRTWASLTMTAMASELGLTVARVSQLVSRAERARETDEEAKDLTSSLDQRASK